MIDSHCHLNFKAFNDDWRAVAQRAFDCGIESIINVGSNLATSRHAIELAETMPGKLYAAIGLHPIHVDGEDFDITDYEKLISCHSEPLGNTRGKLREESLSSSTFHLPPATCHSPIVAIGETGIDLYHSPDNLPSQREVFIQFINLANKHHLPIIIHNRGAGKEVLSVLQARPPQYGGVMHFFSEDWEYAQKLFDLGLNISFTGSITLNNIDTKTIEVVAKVPLEKILIETDAPYVVPVSQKNNKISRNEPAFVIEVAQKIAEIKNIDLDAVTSQTTQNTTKLFKF